MLSNLFKVTQILRGKCNFISRDKGGEDVESSSELGVANSHLSPNISEPWIVLFFQSSGDVSRGSVGQSSGLGEVPRPAPSCSNGAGAACGAGRGCAAIWSQCRRWPLSGREQRSAHRAGKSAAASPHGPASPLPLAPAAGVSQPPAALTIGPVMSLGGASERSVPATKIEITVSCR